MATIQCPNPQCGTRFALADVHLGKKVRCQVCNTIFIGVAVANVTVTPPPAPTPLPVAAIERKPWPAPAAPAPAALADVIPVVVRRVGGSGSSALWIVAALLAFLLPVAGMVLFVVLNW